MKALLLATRIAIRNLALRKGRAALMMAGGRDGDRDLDAGLRHDERHSPEG